MRRAAVSWCACGVREDLHALVRTDSEAAILSDGLLGSAFIQLRAGSETAPLIPDGGALRGVDAVEIADLIAEGRETFRVAADQMVQMRAESVGGRSAASRETIVSTTELIDGIGSSAQRVTEASATLIDEAQGMVAEVRRVMDTVASSQGAVEQVLTETEGTIAGGARERRARRGRDRPLYRTGQRHPAAAGRGRGGDGPRPRGDGGRGRQYRGTEAELALPGLLRRARVLQPRRADRRRVPHAPARTTATRRSGSGSPADRLFETDPDGGLALRDGAARRIEEAMGELLQ